MIKKKSTAPMGTLLESSAFLSHPEFTVFYIQKHHLQLTSAVNTPPRMGPKQMAIPNELETMPRKRGLRSRATDNVTILKAP